MPLLTFPLALILVSCFVCGAIVTWALQERRVQREKDELEKQMARALQTRYEMYEGLEQSVIKLLGRFESLENEFKQRLIEARNPRAALEQTVKLRSRNPELWDIEREHHRAHSEQMGEISMQATRIAELMEQLETLEKSQAEHDGELAHVKSRYETAVANFNESDKAASAKIERLESALGELEPFRSLYEASARDLEAARRSSAGELAARDEQIRALEARVAVLALSEERVRQLEQLGERRASELAAANERTLEITRQSDAVEQRATAAQARCEALAGERDAAHAALARAQVELELARGAQGDVQVQLERVRSELAQSAQALEARSTALDAAVEAGREAGAASAQLERELGLANLKSAQLAKDLSALRSEHETRWNVAQAELAETVRAAQTAQAEALSLKSRLEALEAQHAATHGTWQTQQSALEGQLATANEKAETLARELGQERAALRTERAQFEEQQKLMETALQGSQAQLALYRAKLNHHSSHVEEAWSVLSELKPMLASLEQKLKESDEPAAALPASTMDLSVLDEKPTSSGS